MRGKKRNQIPRFDRSAPEGRPCSQDRQITLEQLIAQLADDKPLPLQGGGRLDTYYNSCNVVLEVNEARARNSVSGLIPQGDTNFVSRIPLSIDQQRLLKDEIAILDIINSNLYDRPIYWAVTCQPSKMMGLRDYLQLEGLALRLTATRHQSDTGSYGVVGSGQVATDKNFKIITEDWKWGNFDVEDTYVNNSYQPAIQAMQLSIRRTAEDFLRKGQQEKGVQLVDQYFAAFPNMNFTYGYQTLFMLELYWSANAYEQAAPIMEQLAKNTAQRLDFFDSISDDILTASYMSEYQQAQACLQRLVQEVNRTNQADLKQRIESILANHMYLLQQGNTPG